MHELLGELKNCLIHNDNSLAYGLTQLRIQINDIEKIIFPNDQTPDEMQKNVTRMHALLRQVQNFKYSFGALQERIEVISQAIHLSASENNCFKATESEQHLEEWKQSEQKEKEETQKSLEELMQKIEQAKLDLVTVAEHE